LIRPVVLIAFLVFQPGILQIWGQTNVAVVGSSVTTNNLIDIQLNYYMFLERVQPPWTCLFSGAGGPVDGQSDALGLNWDPFLGPDVLSKISNPPYQYPIGMYLFPDLDTAYAAALNGCADFEPLYLTNGRKRVDLRDLGAIVGAGPPTWFAIAAGYSTSSHAELPWGPQLEFIDAIRDSTDSSPSLAMSFCANCTAARYANLKSARPDWNVFDLRQGLRQASTFYNSAGGGWREDGGYGFPLVPNQVGDAFPAAAVTTNKAALDAGPPLQPSVGGKCGPNGPQVAFRWYNFRQSTFDHTRITIGNLILDAQPGDSALVLDVGNSWPLQATNAEFVTVLKGPSPKISPPEIYTSVPIPPIIAQPRFNSDTEFQFNIYSAPCNSLSNHFVRIYTSSDLASWRLLQPLCLPDGKGVFRDSQITNDNCRFYRLVQGDLHSQALGFTRVTVAAGRSALIANQVEQTDRSVSNLFRFSAFSGPISIKKEAPVENAAYAPATRTWNNPGMKLNPGEAAWLTNRGSAACIIRFVGDVREGFILSSIAAGSPILSLMLPIPFSQYDSFYNDSFRPDPLGVGSTLRRWDGTNFVDYSHQTFGWVPQPPPLQPGEGFSIVPGFTIPSDKPATWSMAFSGLAPVPYYNELTITGIWIQGEDVVIGFSSVSGQLYALEYSDDESFSAWNTGPDIVGGTGDIVFFTHAHASHSTRRFYRIRLYFRAP
jgi:hypothetical protein